ncbi:lysylphosphatidylglycerol synthase transmembrane domain-containing protein [Sphingomonas faeni]|uniref:lysylphosphatidylglycerol synthase transmembrane domain-containing protein n=1 Tax=Sphingomonas faeni TaxID=185950 RepID=UPI0020C7D1FA|nr:flippase-like domain-containing protein [Sphingomonas faeni]
MAFAVGERASLVLVRWIWHAMLRNTGPVLGMAAIAVVIGAVARIGDLAAFAALLRRARPGWLMVAAVLQAATYLCVASGWKFVLAAAGSPRSFRRLYPIAIGKLFADQVVPVAGMGGNLFVVERLTALAVDRGVAVAALLISMTGFYAAYSACALGMLTLLWSKGIASLWMTGFVLVFQVVALAIPGLAIWIRQRGQRPLSPVLSRFAVVRNLLLIVAEAPKSLLVNRALIGRAVAANGLVFFLDAASLLVCFRALGQDVSFSVTFVAVVVASMIATLGPIPLGLGTFEAGATGMLSLMGVSVEAALAATLLLRVFTLWLPLLPGYLLIRRVLRTKGEPLSPA